MKIIESKITIDTPIDKVWQILADFENYHHWNPFTPKIELTKEIGTDVMLHVRLHPKSKNLIKQKETLLHWEEGKQMDWGITDAWYVRTVRTQYLKSIDANTTEYYTSDIFEGPLSSLILWLFKKKIQIGFDEVAEGLKKRAEQ